MRVGAWSQSLFTARDAFLSVTKLPRCFSVRNILPPFPSLENFKNMILSSLGYLEVTTPEGREESKRKEREPAERPSVYLSSSSPSGLLCSCRLMPQISDASSWCRQMFKLSLLYPTTKIFFFTLWVFDKDAAAHHNNGFPLCFFFPMLTFVITNTIFFFSILPFCRLI